jgi:hypothetical protein
VVVVEARETPATGVRKMNEPRQTTPRTERWTLGDVLDFECELEAARKRADADSVLEREGKLLRGQLGGSSLENIPRRMLFHRWLESRRKESPGLAGVEIDRAFRFGRALMWVAGGVLGGISAGGYLHYFGREPVNVFWFLSLLVAFPLFLSGLAVLLAVAMEDHGGLGVLGGRIFSLVARLSGRKRHAWDAWCGMIEKHGKRFLPLAKWPLLGLTQRFACAFGIGALLALWMRVIFTDLAFGWQSTVGWSPGTWHGVVRFLAAPWTWAFPSGVPTLDEIRGSQFTHVGGMTALDPAATRAWWPFLIGCLAAYSVALRALLIVLLGWNGRLALARLDFDHGDARWLGRKLTGPLFAPEAQPPSGALPDARTHAPRQYAVGGWFVLLAEGAEMTDAALRAGIARALGGTVSRTDRVEIDFADANTAALDAIRNSTDQVAVVIPSGTDPIEGIRKTLAQIAEACAGRACVVLLCGDNSRLALWQRWADARGLEIDLETLPSS